jgi:hypothetical protein
VEIAGEWPHVIAVSPITMVFPKIDASDGRNVNLITWKPGKPQFGQLDLTLAIHKDSWPALKEWVKATYMGEEIRRDGQIEVYDQKGTAVRTFKFYGMYPIKLSNVDIGAAGERGTVSRVTVTLVSDRVEMDGV